MGSKVESEIPFIDLSEEVLGSKQGSSEEWKVLCDKVREACEEYGCFQVAYDGIPADLREEMFMAMVVLFDLPHETKQKNSRHKPYYGYVGNSDVVPLFESLGIEDAPSLDEARAFTDLMWPEGNLGFCHTLNSMSSKMLELELLIRKMIFESFGVGTYYKSHVENSNSVFRVMNYKPPPSDESAVGLVAHTDKNILTILCQDRVQGFELLSKEGRWIQVAPLEGSFMVVVGEAFKAWSNGRLRAAQHRVVMSGDKERYSCGLFATPKEGVVVKVPQELVDKEHPLLFRPFNYMDFLDYFISNLSENALEIYAGV